MAIVLFSCHYGGSRDREDISGQTAAILEQAADDISAQRFDATMEKALDALSLSHESGDALGEVRAFATIVGIDIMASRDADAWDKALQAEAMAREHGFLEELAGILISKAKLCSYAEISPETGRNDEGLEYAMEALDIAGETGAVEQQAEACYIIGSLYINKNRWSDPIDPGIYRTAGEYLDRGQAIADAADIPRLKRNGVMFRSRWFQQGGHDDEAIRYFEQALDGLKEGDHLTAAALDDRLVRLYTRTGDTEKALDAHDDYVFRMENYIRQKQDETLQEMETRFEVQEKEREIERRGYRISLLVVIILLAGLALVLVMERLRKVRRRAAELQRVNDSKQQIIEFLSKDMKTRPMPLPGRYPRCLRKQLPSPWIRYARNASSWPGRQKQSIPEWRNMWATFS